MADKKGDDSTVVMCQQPFLFVCQSKLFVDWQTKTGENGGHFFINTSSGCLPLLQIHGLADKINMRSLE